MPDQDASLAPSQQLRVRLFMATHRPWPLVQHPAYTPIGLGGYQPTEPDALTDDTGDHIAHLNPRYSELSGWYWIWKQIRDVDVVGLCHYRRIFLFDPHHATFPGRVQRLSATPENLAMLAAQNPLPFALAAHARKGVIVPRALYLGASIREQYRICHREEDWEAFTQAVHDTAFQHARRFRQMETSLWMLPYNMMVAPWNFFADYMATLMEVLNRVDTLVHYPDDSYQRRIPAFLAERFFTLHVMTVCPPLLQVPVVITDPTAF